MKTHRIRRLILLALALLPSVSAAAAELTLLPSQRIIAPFSANATEHRMSLVKTLDENLYIGSIGGIVPLADVRAAAPEPFFQLSIGGTFYTNLSSAHRQYVVTNGDYYVDLLADIRITPTFFLRTGLGHTSQHLMDDAFEVRGLKRSINYVRDYAELFAVQHVGAIGGFLYAGAFYNYTFIIDTHRDGVMIYEAGVEALNYPITPRLFCYLAADVKWRGESSFATTQNYQAGLRLSAAGSATRCIRAAINYQTGLEERGQFYNARVNRASIGIYLDL